MTVFDGRDAQAIRQAAQVLADGGLVAFPTETVYGLGARADDDGAVAKIFAAKGRPADHPLIVHVADATALREFAEAPGEAAQRLIQHFWPGPLTLILPRRAGRAEAAAGGQGSIGLRCPAHPVAQALLRDCAALGVAGLAGPSANRFGRISPTTAAHVIDDFGGTLPVLDGGPCDVGIESAIVDCTRERPALLRPGGLDRRHIEAVLGQPLADPDAASPRASGTLAAHYAPRARLALKPAAEIAALQSRQPPSGLAVYSRVALPASAAAVYRVMHKMMPADPASVAHELFAVLREFDAGGASLIWVEQPPAGPEWDGVRDRLQRAAAAAS